MRRVVAVLICSLIGAGIVRAQPQVPFEIETRWSHHIIATGDSAQNGVYLVEDFWDASGYGYVSITNERLWSRIAKAGRVYISSQLFNAPFKGAKFLGEIPQGCRVIVVSGQPGCFVSTSGHRFPTDSIELVNANGSHLQEVSAAVYNKYTIAFDIRMAK